MISRSACFVALTLSIVGCKKDTPDGAAPGSSVGSGASAQSAAAVVGAAAGDRFEGLLELTMSSAHKPTPQVLSIETKGDRARMDMPAGSGAGGFMIFDGAQKKAFIVMDDKKMVMTMDTSKLTAAAVDKTTGAEAPKITRTGKMETIAGYPCENWEIENRGKKSAACMAKGITFFMMNMQDRGVGPSWLDSLLDEKLFPLRMVERDPAGKETMRMEATKVERKAIDDARFAIPAGYQTMDMAALMGAMGGMGGMGATGAGGPGGGAGMGHLPRGMKLPPGVKVPPPPAQPPPRP